MRQRIIDQGPCALCGHGYAAHRVIDAQIERIAAGEQPDEVAEDYSTTVAAMAQTWLAYLAVLQEGTAP